MIKGKILLCKLDSITGNYEEIKNKISGNIGKLAQIEIELSQMESELSKYGTIHM